MTTTPTIPNHKFKIVEPGQHDSLEAKVIAQLRHLRETWADRERPFVVTICVYDSQFLIFDGNPAGKVSE
jgi:hypothetical protein